MADEKATTIPMIYQVKMTLKDSKPPIWRRIQVKDDTTVCFRPACVNLHC